jgi:alanine racemase
MEIRNQIQSGTAICAVLKANAYGHGSVVLARELEHIGVEHVAVATLNEAMELRQHGCQLPILVLGYTPVEKASLAIDLGIKQTIYTLDQAKSFSLAAEKLKKTACLHIKIDTGMSRLGFQPIQQSVDEIVEMVGYPWLQIEGIYTHYATADEADKSETMKQLDKYHWMIKALDARNCFFSIKHTANSAGIIDLPQTHFDMVRAGVMMYGLYPSEEVNHTDITLKRVLSLKTRVAHVKEIAPGTGVSYGLTYRAARPTVIATLPVGYADGFTRLLSGRAEVSIQGKKVPVVGRICMDQCMVDITGMDVKQGDEVILYALTPEKGDTVDDVARKLGTINYEITCMISRRVPRVYLRNGQIVEVWDPLLAE